MQLKDIHKKFYAHIPEDVFWQIVRQDPTYDADGHPQKRGKYTQWLLHAYQRGTIATDADECAFLLSVFHRYRQLLDEKDIMKYDSLQKLRDALAPYLDDPNADVHETSKAMRIRKIKEGAEKVYEDEEWVVFVPHTWEASRYYGKGTRWCTAYDSSDNYFRQYNSQGPLYININRLTKRKWQFHFETRTYCDEHDNSVSLLDVPLSEGLRQFYHSATQGKTLLTSVHTFADAITQWNVEGEDGDLYFGGLDGDTSCIETLILPPTYTDYSDMFNNCRSITSLDLSRWDVSRASSMEEMFYMCENLASLRLDGWDMSALRLFYHMFGLCDRLNTLTLDRCRFPDTASTFEVFECCRDLRVINMHDCDMQSVRFVLREVVASGLYENVTIHLTHDNDERRAYESLTSIIVHTEEVMQQQVVLPSEKNIPDLRQYITELLDADRRLHENPLYVDQLSAGIDYQIRRSLDILSKLLTSKIEMTYTSHRRGPFMITRPDAQQYLKRADYRHREAQALLPVLNQVAEHMPHRRQDVLALGQRINQVPSASQIDIDREVRALGLSNRWHVTMPALTSLMDRITNNTRKGVEHLRYTNKERLRFIFTLVVTIVIFGLMAFLAAIKRGGEYWLMGIFAYGIIRAIVDAEWETLKQKKELKALGWIVLFMVLYLLTIVYVIRPIWKHFHDEPSYQAPQSEKYEPSYDKPQVMPMKKMANDIDVDRPDVQPIIIGTDTLAEADVHLALSDHVPFSNHILPSGMTVAEWCAQAMRRKYMQQHPDADSNKLRMMTDIVGRILKDKSEKELRDDIAFDAFTLYMDIEPASVR